MHVSMTSSRTRAMTLALLLLFSSTALAGDLMASQSANSGSTSGPNLGENASSYVRDYLSDPRRAGSLAGSILGGALSAHPAGPVLGSLFGFFVGKQSMFNEEKARETKSGLFYARRDIVPQNGQEAPTLSFASAQRITFDDPGAGVENQVPMPVQAISGLSREKIVAMCAEGPNVDPRFRALCFYSSGS